MQTVAQYSALVEKALRDYVDNRLPRDPEGLYGPVRYALESGGKRLRPVLTLAVADACGTDPGQALDAALAVEMFHNFTLLHDDVMDHADVRRGRPTVVAKYGQDAAILSGDAMLTLATRLLATGVKSEVLPKALDLFNTTAIEVYEGQQLDVDLEGRADVTEDDYLEMIRLKTSVLLGCACAMGAIVAGADPGPWYKIGHDIGLAFQLRDDYLDTFGDAATFGKAIGGDILNDKNTYLRVLAMRDADARKVIEKSAGMPADARVMAVTRAYTACGADRACLGRIDALTCGVIAAIGDHPFFADLARSIAIRDK